MQVNQSRATPQSNLHGKRRRIYRGPEKHLLPRSRFNPGRHRISASHSPADLRPLEAAQLALAIRLAGARLLEPDLQGTDVADQNRMPVVVVRHPLSPDTLRLLDAMVQPEQGLGNGEQDVPAQRLGQGNALVVLSRETMPARFVVEVRERVKRRQQVCQGASVHVLPDCDVAVRAC